MGKSYWIWYPGDFELYHALQQNFSRVERGLGWPAFWKSEGFRNRVAFRRIYELGGQTEFCIYANKGTVGYVLVGEKKYAFGQTVKCGAGRVAISVHAGCIETFPSIYIEGDVVCSDSAWMVEDYSEPLTPVGYSQYYTGAGQNPAVWEYSEKWYQPVRQYPYENGMLYEFETELTASLQVAFRDGYRPLTVYCGESREEAVDREHCYFSCMPDKTGQCSRAAVRFAYIPDCREGEISVRACHQYVDIPVKAKFTCDDSLLNRIWEVSEHTFRLCSGIFFIDGIKRDKWIWGGDAYQSFFVNQYLMADADINRRTLLALRGNADMTTHINTIVDYSLIWILSVDAHYRAYRDMAFIRQVYPKMCKLMEFCGRQLDGNGFIVPRPQDWEFIDWAAFDREGPLCAEQMLLLQCYRVMGRMAILMGEADSDYGRLADSLGAAVEAHFWDEEKGAYIDSFQSGKRHVTRHANIFAVLFDIADATRKKRIAEGVLLDDTVPAITTPYFKFYELDVLCKMGYLAEVLDQIKFYWGGMLERGAVAFWEEYDPSVPEEEQYDMYGDRFGKSLCHAWSASPIYLLARYFAGLELLSPGGAEYKAEPHLEFFKKLDCTLPVGGRLVHICFDGKTLSVEEK